MDPPSFDFFQPVLSGGTSSNIKIFEGIPLLLYTMGLCEKIFQFLEAVDQKKTNCVILRNRDMKGRSGQDD